MSKLFFLFFISSLATFCTHQTSVKESENFVEVRAPSSGDVTPWTTWYEERTEARALKVLSGIRKKLLKNNLSDPHKEQGYFRTGNIDCKSQISRRYRTADGTCNDFNNPLIGAANVAFGRNVPASYIDNNPDTLMEPQPAVVAKEFFTRNEFKPVPFLNMIAAAWIQFMNHDWLSHYREEKPSISMRMNNGDMMNLEQTKYVDITEPYKKEFDRVSLNEVTHWWDGSQIYGSNQEKQNSLRSFQNGKMRTEIINGNELLPMDKSVDLSRNRRGMGVEMTGFSDNWWLGLSLLHTLFVKEHNAIADMLYKKYVYTENGKLKWLKSQNRSGKIAQRTFKDSKELDEHIFQVARLINSAIMAKIHTVEWTPAILPNPTLKTAMFVNWYGGLNPATWKKDPTSGTTSWFKNVKLGTVLGGIVGGKTQNGLRARSWSVTA